MTMKPRMAHVDASRPLPLHTSSQHHGRTSAFFKNNLGLFGFQRLNTSEVRILASYAVAYCITKCVTIIIGCDL